MAMDDLLCNLPLGRRTGDPRSDERCSDNRCSDKRGSDNRGADPSDDRAVAGAAAGAGSGLGGMTMYRWSGVGSRRARMRIAWSNFSTERDSLSSSWRRSHRGMK
jgi:hypothetical protein